MKISNRQLDIKVWNSTLSSGLKRNFAMSLKGIIYREKRKVFSDGKKKRLNLEQSEKGEKIHMKMTVPQL